MKFIVLTDVEDANEPKTIFVNKDLIRCFYAGYAPSEPPYTLVEFVTGFKMKVLDSPSRLARACNEDLLKAQIVDKVTVTKA